MKGKNIGYIRVSTTEQNPDRQLNDIELDKIFTDFASGSSLDRPQFHQMMEYLRDDDIIYVHSMDRLARNVKDLLKIVDRINKKKATVFFIKENLKFSGDDSPISRLLLMLLGAVAEFELSLIRERQREGVKIAKAAGKYKGRAKCMNKEKIDNLKLMMNSRKPIAKIARELDVSRGSVYRYLKEINNEKAS